MENGNVNSSTSELIDSLVVALQVAREALDESRGNINPERGYADELEQEIEIAYGTVLGAIDSAMNFIASSGK